MSTITRHKPLNLLTEDHHLFNDEYEIECPKPEIRNSWFVWIDGKSLYKKSITQKKLSLRGKVRVLDTGIYLINKWSGNYFHLITEISQKLPLITGDLKRIPILIPYFLAEIPFINGYLKQLSDYRIQVIRAYESILVMELREIDLQIPTGNYHPDLLLEGIGLVSDKIVPKKKSIRALIIRRGTRKILNIDELQPIFKEYDISQYFMEDLKFTEQIQLFKSCEFLAGVHGAGLTNMVWMGESAKILELRRNDDKQNNCYFSLAAACEHDYYYQLCDVDNPEMPTQNNQFIVDPELLEENLKIILN